jgi:uncharacterized protein YjbJ (UPF0337 family)
MREDNLKQQAVGTAQAFIGKVKQAFGQMFGSHDSEREGRIDELRGRAKERTAETADRIEGGLERAGSAAKREAGEVLGSDGQGMEGRAKEIEGRSRQQIGQQLNR